MLTLTNAVAGEPVYIHVVEHEDDLEGFRSFIRDHSRFLGLDTETTGLDIYSKTFRLRLVQFGTPTKAWTIPVELGAAFEAAVIDALKAVQGFVLHNAAFDLQVLDRVLGVPMEQMWPKVTDTAILAHLVDPRAQDEGGFGQSLEECIRHYVDADVADSIKTVMTKVVAPRYKATKETVWKKVELFDTDYQTYSGFDPILAARLMRKLIPQIPPQSEKLIPYEHEVAEVCAIMERTGFLLDVDYSKQLSDELKYDESRWCGVALDFGCENVNSTDQVADVLEARGIKIPGRTPSGKRKVDAELLDALAAQGDPFAHAVSEGKKAGKWRKTWVDKFLSTRDDNDRCHPGINPLRARTGRMSITGIPAQTLPSHDWTIRRCFLADPGQTMVSVDYQAQELRVLAALSGDSTMISAFQNNEDLHLVTARAAFGPSIQKDDPERGYAKVVNFGRVYGGGAKVVAKATGLNLVEAKVVVDGFDKAYPKVKELGLKLQKDAGRDGFIMTRSGRRLPVDPTRAYSSLNYYIQSESRDVTARALVRLHKAGFSPYLRLPLHDEVLASLPTAQAQWGSDEIGRIMAEDIPPVHIGTEGEVGGRSWGSLYGADF